MPTFVLEERDLAWVDRAPVVITKSFTLGASTSEVFDRLAQLAAWSEWCGGMKRVRVDGPASGVGACARSGSASRGSRSASWPGTPVTA